MQIENYNEPYLNVLREYDDGKDYVNKTSFSSPYDYVNKGRLRICIKLLETRMQRSKYLLYLTLLP